MVDKLITPRGLMLAFNADREVQRFFEDVSRTVANSDIDSVPKIITAVTYSPTLTDGSLTIDASVNQVILILKDPNVYKAKIYRIDVEDDTNGAYVRAVLNGTQQDFQMYLDESLIVQDNGESWRVK